MPRKGASLTESEVKTFTLANGPAFAHPRFVSIVDEIPLAGTNKPDRRKLIGTAEEEAKVRRAQRPLA